MQIGVLMLYSAEDEALALGNKSLLGGCPLFMKKHEKGSFQENRFELVRESSYEIVFFLDADDQVIFTQTLLDEVRERFSDGEVDALRLNKWFFGERLRELNHKRELYKIRPFVGGTFFRRPFLLKEDFWDPTGSPNLHEIRIWKELFRTGRFDLLRTEEPLLIIANRPNSLSKRTLKDYEVEYLREFRRR